MLSNATPSDRCPHCGFGYGWDGVNCTHCDRNSDLNVGSSEFRDELKAVAANAREPILLERQVAEAQKMPNEKSRMSPGLQQPKATEQLGCAGCMVAITGIFSIFAGMVAALNEKANLSQAFTLILVGIIMVAIVLAL